MNEIKILNAINDLEIFGILLNLDKNVLDDSHVPLYKGKLMTYHIMFYIYSKYKKTEDIPNKKFIKFHALFMKLVKCKYIEVNIDEESCVTFKLTERGANYLFEKYGKRKDMIANFFISSAGVVLGAMIAFLVGKFG